MNPSDRPILEVLKEHSVVPQPDGSGRLKADCPFCGKFGFSVSQTKNCFYCFECKEGGGVIKFLQKIEGKTRNQVMGIGRPAKSDVQLAEYDYCDEHGALLYQAVDLADGTRRFCRKGEHNRMVWNMDGIDRVPYNLHFIVSRPQSELWICSNEKDCDCLREIGILSTTCCEGLEKWSEVHCRQCLDRGVVLVPANTDEGRMVMDAIMRAVHTYAKYVNRIEFPSICSRYTNLAMFRVECTAVSEFGLAIGKWLQQPVPGLFYTQPEDGTPEQMKAVQEAAQAAKNVMPVSPKGRKVIWDCFWAIEQAKPRIQEEALCK